MTDRPEREVELADRLEDPFEGLSYRTREEAADALRTLTAERDRLEADAKRLDWLQENLAQLDAWAGGTFTVEDLDGVQYYGDTLRQAVDAARRTDTEGGEDE